MHTPLYKPGWTEKNIGSVWIWVQRTPISFLFSSGSEKFNFITVRAPVWHSKLYLVLWWQHATVLFTCLHGACAGFVRRWEECHRVPWFLAELDIDMGIDIVKLSNRIEYKKKKDNRWISNTRVFKKKKKKDEMKGFVESVWQQRLVYIIRCIYTRCDTIRSHLVHDDNEHNENMSQMQL